MKNIITVTESGGRIRVESNDATLKQIRETIAGMINILYDQRLQLFRAKHKDRILHNKEKITLLEFIINEVFTDAISQLNLPAIKH